MIEEILKELWFYIMIFIIIFMYIFYSEINRK